jgi:hypothetical protein
MEFQRYRLDGRTLTFSDDSAGEIPNWERKVGTDATWDGESLTLHTDPFAEVTDPANGELSVRHSINSLLTFRLATGGRELTVERTGFRVIPPTVLHGLPYRREDDLAYRTDVALYVKVDP